MLDDSDGMILSVVVAVIFWLCGLCAAAAGVWESIGLADQRWIGCV
jgi:hypothetical protein